MRDGDFGKVAVFDEVVGDGGGGEAIGERWLNWLPSLLLRFINDGDICGAGVSTLGEDIRFLCPLSFFGIGWEIGSN